MKPFDREANDLRLLSKAQLLTQFKVAASLPSDTTSSALGSTSAVAVSSPDAGVTYTAAEQTLINELKIDVNQLKTDFNALVTVYNTLLTDHNDLVNKYNALLVNLKSVGLMST